MLLSIRIIALGGTGRNENISTTKTTSSSSVLVQPATETKHIYSKCSSGGYIFISAFAPH